MATESHAHRVDGSIVERVFAGDAANSVRTKQLFAHL
jgi:hypothetical protein